MRVLVVIPARWASTRLPAKPLLRESGRFLIEHVYDAARQARGVDALVVATDDERIADAVRSFGGQVQMTREDHPSGTDRVAEVAEHFPAEFIINIQGDEPELDPGSIEQLAELIQQPETDVATLAVPIRQTESYLNPNCVKVVRADDGRALYFSRSPIPFYRDGVPSEGILALQHVGVYAFRRAALAQFAKTPPHPLELTEKLEQLRLLGTGRTIRVGLIEEARPGIDTPADYAAFVERCRARSTLSVKIPTL
ncbi:MAG: 3-deoxy-manno-octulosonate cytidylyltransferase [Gemmataceae bacterium]